MMADMMKTGMNKMKFITEKVNRTLFELEVGILIFGVVCQLFVFFVKDKAGYSIGLWIGVVTAFLVAVHMWWSLDKGLDYGEKAAVGFLTRQNIFRYLGIIVIFAVICITEIGNPLSAFLGIMGLKAGAYLQPLTKKISRCIYGEEILPPLIEEPDDCQE